jgi:uncharacterized damage-inducible protein DinB
MMKYAIRMCALAAAVVVAAPHHALAQAPAATSLKADLVKDWSGLKDTMTRIANEMPADKFNAKPTPAQQSFGERVVHIATVNNRFLGAVGGTAKAPTVDPKAAVMSKEAAIKAMQDSFDYGTALLNEQTDQTLLQAAAMPPAFLGPSTRARMFVFLIGHTWDIYGQMVVYLRLNGGVPPASQRP